MRILETLLAGLRTVCTAFPDKRKSESIYSMTDIGMSAFSLFFMQSESFLSYQRSLEEGRRTSNCQTLFGMTKIPTDNHIRSMLDPVHPSHLQPAFDQVIAVLGEHGGMKAFQRLGGRTLIALDGTEYFCSQKLGCPHCLTRKRSNGKIESYHSMLAATIVAPGHAMVVPLMPEFIGNQDGADKQDCERVAAKRWLATHAERMAPLKPIYLGDDLFACQPIVSLILNADADVLMTAKPESHKALYDFMSGAQLSERVERRKLGGKTTIARYRWFIGAPLRDGKDALTINWLGVTLMNDKGKVTYDNAFATSLPVCRETVAEIAACARARWKVENEGFNVLKNNGYALEHNFGHGKDKLAMTFAAMNMLAFAFHTVCECLEELWIKAREAKRARKRLFEHIRILTVYHVFQTWNALMKSIIDAEPPPEIQTQTGL